MEPILLPHVERLIMDSDFAEELDYRGIPVATWLRERQEEGKGQHWICATLHNKGVAEYDKLSIAYDKDFNAH